MSIKNKLIISNIIILILIVSFLIYVKSWSNTFTRVSELDMLSYLYLWSKEGRPEGKKLDEFMLEGRFNIVQTNREFVIDGTNITSKFACLRRPGKTLFATTNILIWVSPSGKIIGEPKEWKYKDKHVGDSEKPNKEEP